MELFIAMKRLLSFCCDRHLPIVMQVILFYPSSRNPSCLINFIDLKRSRDPAVLGTCDIVVDVGAVYDESKQLFDHHQRGFTEVFGHGFITKLSSAGLVYKLAQLISNVQ